MKSFAYLFRSVPGSKDSSTGPKRILAIVLAGIAGTCHAPVVAQSMKAEISGSGDFSFGQIANLQLDQRRSQTLCVAANSNGLRYSVLATGSGSGATFALSNGSYALPYTVEWSPTPGQSSGTQLSANTPLSGQETTERGPRCKDGPTASVTVVLRSAELSRAQQGDYAGTLTLLISPE